jgi:hypothetical protein
MVAAGLLALIRLHRARADARFNPAGTLVLLEDQERSRWNHSAIQSATQLLTRAARQQRPGPYQLQATIVTCHAEAETWPETDWEQILLLYDMLLVLAPLPVTRLHRRTVALRYTAGPQAALSELDTLAGTLDGYHLYHATRAEVLRGLGRPDEARTADERPPAHDQPCRASPAATTPRLGDLAAGAPVCDHGRLDYRPPSGTGHGGWAASAAPQPSQTRGISRRNRRRTDPGPTGGTN